MPAPAMQSPYPAAGTFRFTVSADTLENLYRCALAEIERFTGGPIMPGNNWRWTFDADAVSEVTGDGLRSVLYYEANVEVRIP